MESIQQGFFDRAGDLAVYVRFVAVDFAPSRKTAELADLLVAETLSDPGVVVDRL